MGLDYEFFDGGPDIKAKSATYNRDNPVVGRTATEIDRNMRQAGWGGLFKDDQQRDHCKFLEKQIKRGYIGGGKCNLRPAAIEGLMKQYNTPDRA